MKSMPVFAVKCELCNGADALAHRRLCEACTDAIVRLIFARERISTHWLNAAKRVQPSSDAQFVRCYPGLPVDTQSR